MAMAFEDKRVFARHFFDLPVTVSSKKPSGESLEEKTVLRDVSGGGVRFHTLHKNWYLPGQEVGILISLPRSGNVCAYMTATGRIVHKTDVSDSQRGESDVGVMLVTPLYLQRFSGADI